MNTTGRPLPRALERVRLLPAYRTPRAVRPWTDLTGSMTRAIARVTGGQPQVALSYQGPDRLRSFEARALGTTVGHRVWAREIELVVHGQPLLQARSVTLLDDPTLPMLQGLGHAPLAEVLFVDPRWRRPGAAQALTAEPAGSTEPPLSGRQCLWQRRGGGRLLVEEYFLPPLLSLALEVADD